MRLSFLALACFLMASCETIKGVGRDIESTGEAIDDVFLTGG